MDADSGNELQRTWIRDVTVHWDVSWSPKGEYIAFSAPVKDGVDFGIYLFDRRTRQLTLLTKPVYPYTSVAWSADGAKMVFDRGDDLYVMDSDGGNLKNLTNTGKNAFEQVPAVSRDGSVVYLLGNLLSVTDLEGNDPQTLQPTKFGGLSDPTWTPDGRQIVFGAWLGEQDRVGGIYVVNRDGTGLRTIVEEKGGIFMLPRVFDPASLDVSPQGKMATRWGTLKQRGVEQVHRTDGALRAD